jgi:hypothetical protein
VATPFREVPDWTSWENQGANVAVADLDGDGQPELIILRVDHPTPGPNAGFYRVGRRLAADGTVAAWGPWLTVPDWSASENQGAGLAVANFGPKGLALVVFQVEHRTPGPNRGLYRVGRRLDAQGNVTGGWSDWAEVPDWRSWRDQGAAIVVNDLDGDGRPELLVFHIDDFHGDNPGRPNKGLYRVGLGLTPDGQVSGWGDWAAVDWFSWFNQGAGLGVADLDGDGRPELVVFQIDNPTGMNAGYYRVGWGLEANGVVKDGWGPWVSVGDWSSAEDQGGGIALWDFAGRGRPDLVVFHVDHPPGPNAGLYAVLRLELDVDRAQELGVWRLLRYFSEVLPVHAALLHTGKVLLFAGSGNNVFRFESPDFGNEARQVYTSVVWDPINNTFDHPATLRRANGRPIDFFCCGHCFLPDGRLLVVGGTDKYDKELRNNVPVDSGHGFVGLSDALIFDPSPAPGNWKAVASMRSPGRWYPTALPLGDGTPLVASGMIANGKRDPTLEHNTDPDSQGWEVVGNVPLPLYPHLFLLRDGRLFFTGGRMDTRGKSTPGLFDPLAPGGAFVPVDNLSDPDKRNQSASVLLPPAQAQRVLIMGGGPEDETEATARVDVIDLTEPRPSYRPALPMQFDRMHVNAVLLPDRTVLATGGGGTREAGAGGAVPPDLVRERLVAEVFDPATGSQGAWRSLAQAQVGRLYHSVALLLPNGQVLVAGGNPDKGGQVPWLPPDPLEEMRLELFSPPYLFRGPRPVIESAPDKAAYGASIAVRCPQAGRVKWASLVRPGLTTHSFNVEQRLVDLPFTVEDVTLRCDVTGERNLAPPGWYMLFLTDTEGVPSVAHWLLLG